MRRIKPEKLIGMLFVLALHGAALYGMWSYRIIPPPEEAITLMVSLINPPPPEQPKPPAPKPPEPPKAHPPEPPPEPQRLVAETPAVLPDEPLVYVPPQPPPEPVVEAPPLPPQPVVLSRELAVSCPNRSPPDYPSTSVRMHEQGTVLLRVVLGENGRVESIEVKTSSGYRRLDDSAIRAVKSWKCEPSIQNGVTVRAIAMQPINFTLAGD